MRRRGLYSAATLASIALALLLAARALSPVVASAPAATAAPTSAQKAPGPVGSRFEGRVIKVKDGDSLLVQRLDRDHVSEIRMAGIDAPEWGQPWGQQASVAMKRLVLDKPVTVEVTDKDIYGRLVARVWQDGVYVNAAMACSGDAWAFDRYMPDAGIRACHNAAMQAGRGLWALPAPDRLPPATWRARHPR